MTFSAESRRSFLKKSVAALTLIPWTIYAEPSALLGGPDPTSRKSDFLFRFAVASDGHYGQDKTDYKTSHGNLSQWLANEKKTKGLDACVFNGDLVHDNVAWLPEVKGYFDQVKVPYYVTRGNHDLATATVWTDTWGYGFNHSVDLGKYAFILGDTSNEEGKFLSADADWLANELQKYASKQYVFVFLHIAQYPWSDGAIDSPEVRKVLARFPNVAAVFHGHQHDQDSVKIEDNVHYFFDGHYGGNWGTDYKGYRIIEIRKNGSLTTYQCNPKESKIVNNTQLVAAH